MTDDATAQADEATDTETVEEVSPEEQAKSRNVQLAARTTEIVNASGAKYKIRAKSPEVWDTVLQPGSELDLYLTDEVGPEGVLAIGSGSRRASADEAKKIKELCASFQGELEFWPKGICAYHVVLTQDRQAAEAEAEQAEVTPETADQE